MRCGFVKTGKGNGEVLTLLRAEVERDMALLGLKDIAAINRDCLAQD